jgi:hypothetical protein
MRHNKDRGQNKKASRKAVRKETDYRIRNPSPTSSHFRELTGVTRGKALVKTRRQDDWLSVGKQNPLHAM